MKKETITLLAHEEGLLKAYKDYLEFLEKTARGMLLNFDKIFTSEKTMCSRICLTVTLSSIDVQILLKMPVSILAVLVLRHHRILLLLFFFFDDYVRTLAAVELYRKTTVFHESNSI